MNQRIADFVQQIHDVVPVIDDDRLNTGRHKTPDRRRADRRRVYGGEEFACILGFTDLDGAAHLTETLRESIQKMRIPHAGSPHAFVTISCGVEVMVPAGNGLPCDLIEKADNKLYAAKAAGRNRVIC